MTIEFRRSAACPNCGFRIPLEDEFNQWVRNHPQLRSGDGFVFIDHDLIDLRFRVGADRSVQHMLCLEVKTRGAKLNDVQRDALHMHNQIFRNRRETPRKDLPIEQSSALGNYVYSIKNGRVRLRAFGYHVLSMNGSTPDNSSEIVWDGSKITTAQLLEILRFERDPDNPRRTMDLRVHHRRHPLLF